MGNPAHVLPYLEKVDHVFAGAVGRPVISKIIKIASCSEPTCATKLPMRFTYYIDGPSEPIIRITREADVCLHCATKMFLAAGDLAHALNG